MFILQIFAPLGVGTPEKSIFLERLRRKLFDDHPTSDFLTILAHPLELTLKSAFWPRARNKGGGVPTKGGFRLKTSVYPAHIVVIRLCPEQKIAPFVFGEGRRWCALQISKKAIVPFFPV